MGIPSVVTIITPTTGKNTLFNLIDTIKRQNVPVDHILLWDDKKEDRFVDELSPYSMDVISDQYKCSNFILQGKRINGIACGSALRAIGLMAANTDFVTFADDDVMWEDGHLLSLLQTTQNPSSNWAFCKRKIWSKVSNEEFELLGVDEFESVGEEAKTPYKMVDNNCMLFRRRFGVSAACLYRETQEYNDDRLMYAFLKKYAGEPEKTNLATINQVCPERLIEFFKTNCTKVL